MYDIRYESEGKPPEIKELNFRGIITAPPEAKPELIVDYGCSENPIVASRRLPVYSNETYYCVDKDPHLGPEIDRAARRKGREAITKFIYSPDGELKELRDSSVSKVVVKNVFGVPDLSDRKFFPNWRNLDKGLNFSSGKFGPDWHNLNKILREAERVLKIGGRLYGIEDLTPEVVSNFFSSSEILVRYLKDLKIKFVVELCQEIDLRGKDLPEGTQYVSVEAIEIDALAKSPSRRLSPFLIRLRKI